MKMRLMILAFVLAAAGAWAQEYDDMYFNSGDRVKANTVSKTFARRTQLSDTDEAEDVPAINPTDSYSARTENPEYTSRRNNSGAEGGEADYFVADYQPPVTVNPNFTRNNFNTGGFNPYFNNFNTFNTFNPYFNSFGNPWGFYDPFWGPGWGGGFNPAWSTSIGYSFGGFNPGWFGSVGYNWGWGNSMWAVGSAWNSWGWGSPWGFGSSWNNWGWGGGWYPGNVIIVDNGSRNVAYGKRSSRSRDVNNNVSSGRNSANIDRASGYTRTGRSTTTAATGRTRSSGDQSSQYYDRSWRRNSESSTTRSYWNNSDSRNSSNTRSSWNNSGWGNNDSRGRTNSDWSSPSRSSWSSGSDGGSRGSWSSGSSGSRSSGSSGGSSSGSRSRGRN